MYIFVSLQGVGQAARALERNVEREIRRALLAIGDDIASVARQTHPWQNRTGDLEGATVGYSVLDGSFWDDTLEGGAVGATEYGSYLEDQDRWAFLEPAYNMIGQDAFARRIDVALERAIQAAGWN